MEEKEGKRVNIERTEERSHEFKCHRDCLPILYDDVTDGVKAKEASDRVVSRMLRKSSLKRHEVMQKNSLLDDCDSAFLSK